MQCPNCSKLITFDSGSEDINIRRALSLGPKASTGTDSLAATWRNMRCKAAVQYLLLGTNLFSVSSF
jgi:hypothetical protein